MADEKPINRRGFFRQGLGELMKPLLRVFDPLEQAASRLAPPDSKPIQSSAAAGEAALRRVQLDVWLRPPGALLDPAFLQTCSRCAACVEACPAQCIKIDASGARGKGVPYIEPDAMPCVVCESLACMNTCPTAALVLTPRVEIDMGTAIWREHSCLRSHGEDCTICIDQCPMGEMALKLEGGEVAVQVDGCVGCGVCQHYCPTQPKSIVVIPKSARAPR